MPVIKVGNFLDISRNNGPGSWIEHSPGVHVCRIKKIIRVKPWLICPYSEGTVLRHYHGKSEIAWATEYCKGGVWLCCACREEVPSGVMFMARTHKLRGLL